MVKIPFRVSCVPLHTKKYVTGGVSLCTLICRPNDYAMQHAIKEAWTTIPVLPCADIKDTLAFWESLGFITTYKQTHPYQYGVVARGGAALHFVRVKGIVPESNYSNCLIAVANAGAVYLAMTGSLKQSLGRVPHGGLPRISRMKPGATRFTLTDVAGNAVIFVSEGGGDQADWEKAEHISSSRLAKAIAMAVRYRDYKHDDLMADRVLEGALRNVDGERAELVAEAWIIRAELAEARLDVSLATAYREQAAKLPLSEYVLLKLREKHITRDSNI